MEKRKNKQSAKSQIVTNEFIIWCAIAVIGYSLVVPLLALESLAAAELAMRFTLFYHAALLTLALIGLLQMFGQLIELGWKLRFVPIGLAVLLLILSIGPSKDCCSVLVIALSGNAPLSEIGPADIGFHLLPVVGASIFLFGSLTRPQGRASVD